METRNLAGTLGFGKLVGAVVFTTLRAAVMAGLLLAGMRCECAQHADSFLVRVGDLGVRAGLEVHWFLTGEFGGVGGTESQITDEGVMVSTQYEGKPATGLRAVLYAPGCEMQLVRVDNLRLEDTPRESEFACRKVARIKLEGKVHPTEVSFDEDSEVRVDYVANWVNPFMGIMDGPCDGTGGRACLDQ